MRLFISSLVFVCTLWQCAEVKLTPAQTDAIAACEAKVTEAALGEACLARALAGGSLEATAISCGIELVIKAVPTCAAIIPTFLTVVKDKDMVLGNYPKAADDQQTEFGKALKDRVNKALKR